jgi:hypothetical protein
VKVCVSGLKSLQHQADSRNASDDHQYQNAQYRHDLAAAQSGARVSKGWLQNRSLIFSHTALFLLCPDNCPWTTNLA